MKRFLFNRKRSVTLIAIAVACFVFNGYSQEPDPNFHVYLAFGQSNMEGFPGVEEQDKTGVDPRFQVLYAADADAGRAKGTWATALPPLCRSGAGLCPCDYFGRTLVDSLPENIKVGIINVSLAGTKIEVFDKDKYQGYLNGLPQNDQYIKNIANNSYGGSPFGRLVEMGKLAQKDGVIKGILFHQGESGAMPGNNWGDVVKKIYSDLLKDLSLDAAKVPFIAGDLLNGSAMVKGLAQSIPNCFVASSQGLPGRDQWHFTAQGYRDFGKRYAELMLPIIKNDLTGVVDRKIACTSGWGNHLHIASDGKSISFILSECSQVSLNVFSLAGKEIAVIPNAQYSVGKHTLRFGRNGSSEGVFVVALHAGSFSATQTIMASVK